MPSGVLTGACPIVGSYGGKDRSPMGRSAAGRLERARAAAAGAPGYASRAPVESWGQQRQGIAVVRAGRAECAIARLAHSGTIEGQPW